MQSDGPTGHEPGRDVGSGDPTTEQPRGVRARIAARSGLLETLIGIPILAALAVVALTAGNGTSVPAAAPVPPAAVSPASPGIPGSATGPSPTVPGEVGDGGIVAGAEGETAQTPQQIAKELAPKGLVMVDAPPAQLDLSFKVASFNILGASHTQGPRRRKGFAGALARMPAQIRALQDRGITVAGMQEFQVPQVRAFERAVGGQWDVYPGDTMGNLLADNSIIWRSDVWEAVDKRITNIPYFGGRPRGMPQVLLQHRTTGHRIWVGNFHNPADVHGPAGGFRARAVAIEAQLAKELGADGTPVIFTGDMNDRAAFGCSFTAQSGMVSADGTRTENGRCILPSRVWIDWILGSKGVTLSAYEADYGLQKAKVSDHPIIVSTATLPARTTASKCQIRPSTKGSIWFCPKGRTG